VFGTSSFIDMAHSRTRRSTPPSACGARHPFLLQRWTERNTGKREGAGGGQKGTYRKLSLENRGLDVVETCFHELEEGRVDRI
jgi:hypothetical protein